MRILLDENIPRGLRRILQGHDVRTASEMGWASIANGQLLDEAEKAGFDALGHLRPEHRFSAEPCRAKHRRRRPFHQQVGNNTSPAADRAARRRQRLSRNFLPRHLVRPPAQDPAASGFELLTAYTNRRKFPDTSVPSM